MPGWIVVARIPGGENGGTAEYYAAWIEDPAQAIAAVERDFDPEDGVEVSCEGQLTDDNLRGLGVAPGETGWIDMPEPPIPKD